MLSVGVGHLGGSRHHDLCDLALSLLQNVPLLGLGLNLSVLNDALGGGVGVSHDAGVLLIGLLLGLLEDTLPLLFHIGQRGIVLLLQSQSLSLGLLGVRQTLINLGLTLL